MDGNYSILPFFFGLTSATLPSTSPSRFKIISSNQLLLSGDAGGELMSDMFDTDINYCGSVSRAALNEMMELNNTAQRLYDSLSPKRTCLMQFTKYPSDYCVKALFVRLAPRKTHNNRASRNSNNGRAPHARWICNIGIIHYDEEARKGLGLDQRGCAAANLRIDIPGGRRAAISHQYMFLNLSTVKVYKVSETGNGEIVGPHPPWRCWRC